MKFMVSITVKSKLPIFLIPLPTDKLRHQFDSERLIYFPAIEYVHLQKKC